MSQVTVSHNPEKKRFEVIEEGHKAILTYVLEGESIRFTHTIVPKELGGRGIGSALAVAGLNHAKDKHWSVIPQCPFVFGYIERHPEWQELVLPGWEDLPRAD